MSQKIKLFLDFDGCIVNTIRRICDLYDEDFCEYDNYRHIDWSEIDSWEFKELVAATPKYLDEYFNQPRFFENLTYMPWAKETMIKLNEFCDITIVSCGNSPNLRLKSKWIKENLPFCEFQGVDFKTNCDKRNVEMVGGIFIDDSISNLTTSNAEVNICFGEEYPWNKEWSGIRCYNWCDVLKTLNMYKENEDARESYQQND